MSSAITPVAVGILIDKAGFILMSTRPPSKSYPGYWEFPGGKIKQNESSMDALKREIKEEIMVSVLSAKHVLSQVFTDEKATVHLHFFLVNAWRGVPLAAEGQTLSWQNPQNITIFPLLEANRDILMQLATKLSRDK